MFSEKLVHLDMKGAPPRPDHLISLFPLMKKWGVTGLCIEWEDILPYSGAYKVLRAPDAYTKQELEKILAAAKEAGLKIVPLIQTFGHLEFLLKHDEFAEIRELPEKLMDICPLHDKALDTITGLVDQVIELNPGIEAIHLGGDEVWTLGSCDKCRKFIEEKSRAALYLHHMRPVMEHVKAKGLRALVWDDMFRKWPVVELERLAEVAEPVVWTYGRDISTRITPDIWERFEAAFPRLWGASAFKGAGGRTINWPLFEDRALNHDSWAKKSRDFDFAGIILTGWSRYHHFATLCEIPDAAFPSLALSLRILDEGGFKDELRSEVFKSLGIGDMPFMHKSTEAISNIPVGNFPGAKLFSLLGKLQGARQLYSSARIDSEAFFPAHNWNRSHPFLYKEIWERAHRAVKIIEDVSEEIQEQLDAVLQPDASEEFYETKINTLLFDASGLAEEARRMYEESTGFTLE